MARRGRFLVAYDGNRPDRVDAIRREAPNVAPCSNWEKLEAVQTGLFLWEAFVTGDARAAKNGQHFKDASCRDSPEEPEEPVRGRRAVAAVSCRRSVVAVGSIVGSLAAERSLHRHGAERARDELKRTWSGVQDLKRGGRLRAR